MLLFLWVLDRRERESVWLFGGAIAWGAVISTGLSALFIAFFVLAEIFREGARLRDEQKLTI